MTQPLFDAPAEPKLTPAQQAVYDHVRIHGPVRAHDVGVVAGANPYWAETRGNAILRSLRKKGLVRYKQRLGWVVEGWRPADDGPGPGTEIPF